MAKKMTSKRVLIMLPEPWIKAIRREAKQQGISFSAYLGESAVARLPAPIREKLPPRRLRGRPVKSASP